MNKKYCVITTVNKPTKAIEVLYEKFGENLIIVADEKTPKNWEYKGIKPIENKDKYYAQKNSYAKKNLGYLEAMMRGAECINSTDDDNCPNDNWKIRENECIAFHSFQKGWCNTYSLFSDIFIYPRGFSLRHINENAKFTSPKKRISSIQQGLADGEADVDAIWRLTNLGTKVKFQNGGSIYLQPETWCPFNTQSTWVFKKAFPLMYLPVCCSMRVTDIWSSFVAQRCLWEINDGVTFHSPSEVYQDRNEHDLMKDFEDEISGYLNNDKIVEILSGLKLKQGEENICANMFTCYAALVENKILPLEELTSLSQWIKDYNDITRNI